MKEALLLYQKDGVNSVVFGDLFLEEIKEYREQLLGTIGMTGVFPIWKRDTSEIVRSFIELGFKAIVTCVDSKVLDISFAGKMVDDQFLSSLPPGVDPCGENGEFHTFVYSGPLFKEEIRFKTGELVSRDGFYFCDLLPD
jgi:uncharacterized protein (TIGR00290 family)